MKVKLIVIGVILGILSGVMGYFGTLYLDKLKKGGEVNIKVTLEDTDEFKLENNKKQTKEDALKEWPYIFYIDNSGDGKGLYQIKMIDSESNTIKREDLSYVLLLDDKEIKSGKLGELKDNLLYQGEILGNIKQSFKLYVYLENDYQEEDLYQYKIDVVVIKSGGPGF